MARKLYYFTEIGSNKKLHCNSCNQTTTHQLIGYHRKYHEDVFLNFSIDRYFKFENLVGDLDDMFSGGPEIEDFRLFMCLGCETCFLEVAHTFWGLGWYLTDEEISEEEEHQHWFIEWFPERKISQKNHNQYRYLDQKLATIYKEVIDAYNIQANILCAMGIRAIIEGICVSKGITDKDAFGLKQKIEALAKKDIVKQNIAEGLMRIKFVGDSAAHGLEEPDREDLDVAIDAIEELMNYLYEFESKFDILKKRASND